MDPIEAIGRLGARLSLQQAVDEELTDFLGRERYERRGEPTATQRLRAGAGEDDSGAA